MATETVLDGFLPKEGKDEMNFAVRRMTLGDYDAVVALWRATPGIGLDSDSDSRIVKVTGFVNAVPDTGLTPRN